MADNQSQSDEKWVTLDYSNDRTELIHPDGTRFPNTLDGTLAAQKYVLSKGIS